MTTAIIGYNRADSIPMDHSQDSDYLSIRSAGRLASRDDAHLSDIDIPLSVTELTLLDEYCEDGLRGDEFATAFDNLRRFGVLSVVKR